MSGIGTRPPPNAVAPLCDSGRSLSSIVHHSADRVSAISNEVGMRRAVVEAINHDDLAGEATDS